MNERSDETGDDAVIDDAGIDDAGTADDGADARAVADARRALAQLEWGNRGAVAVLVETPRPHEHVVRDEVEVVNGKGFAGDHDRKSFYKGQYVPGREVSAISEEVLTHLNVDPVVVGDNLITRGIDLAALEQGDLVQVGDVVLARSHRAHRPCATFRERTSPEAYAVVSRDRYRGALFVVRSGGLLRTGDVIERLPQEEVSTVDASTGRSSKN